MHLVFSAEPCPRLRILEEEDPVARGGTQRYVRRRVPTLATKVAPAFPALYAGCDRTKTATPRSTALRQSLTSSVLFSTFIRRQSRVSSPSTYSLTNKISPPRGPVKGSFAEFSPAGRPAPAEKILSFPLDRSRQALCCKARHDSRCCLCSVLRACTKIFRWSPRWTFSTDCQLVTAPSDADAT